MNDRHGGIPMQEQHGHGQTHQITPPDDHGVLPLDVHADPIQQLDASLRSARHVERQRGEIFPVQFGGSSVRARGEETGGVGGMQAVHVFVRPDRP
mmetsp:Transcript_30372/g.64584  ORF Transcript_30372/g.64584 Transcript_30372/m.64584 type:complete len:96 (-) Transcript_30372:633-920(-)